MDADIIVIGGGFAGLTVAARAGEFGCKALVLEQGTNEEYQCNSRWSGGHLSICMDNANGPPEGLAAKIMKGTGGEADARLVDAYTGDAKKAIAWLQGHGVRFMRIGDDPARQWVMVPPRTAQPGLDWRGRGPDVAMRQLTELVRRGGGEITLDTQARQLVMSGNRCVGVEVLQEGSRRTILGRAVVIADGGFQANEEYVRRFVASDAGHLMRRNAGTGRGDGLRMAESVGAKLVGTECFYGHLLARDAFTNDKLWPHPYLDALAISGIVVGKDGRRFLDEGKGGVYIANMVARRPDALEAVVIFDQAVWEGPGANPAAPPLPNPTLKLAKATIHCAATIGELADMAGLPKAALETTATRYNDALAGDATRSLEPARTTEKYPAYALRKPPFYAIPACSGITYTMGGPAIDVNARVIHKDGHAIDGLFAVGSAFGGLEGGPDVAYVGGLAKAFIFGLRAAEYIAAEATRVRAA